ncbi:MAG: DUF4347 domain-containing protein [Thermoanaerobaculia bacterium]
MEINVVDVSDRGLLRTEWRLQQLGKTVIESNLDISNAVAQMVKDVIAAAGSPGSVSVLRIYSHGNKGVFNIAGEIGYDKDGKKENYSTEKDGNAIAVSNIKQLEPFLRNLAPYFAPQARVELQGCLVGGGSEGETLLRELARIWRVRVQASTEESSITAIEFTGLVVEASPSGGLTSSPATPMAAEKTGR